VIASLDEEGFILMLFKVVELLRGSLVRLERVLNAPRGNKNKGRNREDQRS